MIHFSGETANNNADSFSANNNAHEKDDNNLCLRLLGDTHLKLHAYTLAEYCYWTSRTVNLNYLISLVEQNVESKCKDAIALIPKVNNNAALIESNRNSLAETFIKYVNPNCFQKLNKCS